MPLSALPSPLIGLPHKNAVCEHLVDSTRKAIVAQRLDERRIASKVSLETRCVRLRGQAVDRLAPVDEINVVRSDINRAIDPTLCTRRAAAKPMIDGVNHLAARAIRIAGVEDFPWLSQAPNHNRPAVLRAPAKLTLPAFRAGLRSFDLPTWGIGTLIDKGKKLVQMDLALGIHRLPDHG